MPFPLPRLAPRADAGDHTDRRPRQPHPFGRAVTAARTGWGAFRDDTRGTLTVETALMAPLLCLIYVAAFVWFDAFRAQTTTLKATYTVSDMISRETVPLDDTYMAWLNELFDTLTFSPAPTQLRVTTAKCSANCQDEENRVMEMCWSWSTPAVDSYTPEAFQTIVDEIPLIVLGDTVVVTESFMAYQPAFDVKLGRMNLSHRIVTRPRFAPQINLNSQSCY